MGCDRDPRRDSSRRGWSRPRSGGDQSAGQMMRSSAGDEGGAVFAGRRKKYRPSAVAREAGFRLPEQAKEGKRDSSRRGWSRPRSGGDQSAGQMMRSREAGFRLPEQAKEGKRDS